MLWVLADRWCSGVGARRFEGCSKSSRNLELCGYDGKQRGDMPLSLFSPEVDAKTMYVMASELLFPKLVPLKL